MKAQTYPQIVTFENSDEVSATFTSVGVAEKAKDAAENAAQSLFYTLFYTGVDGINGGRPLITKDNKEYVATFLALLELIKENVVTVMQDGDHLYCERGENDVELDNWEEY